MPVNKIAQLLGEDAHRFWTIFNYWINKAYHQDGPSTITKIGIDETSRRKGHNYITVAVDLDHNKVVYITVGKDIQVADIKDYLCEKGTNLANITQASIDLSPAFISGILTHFPKASITFDKFHVVKLLNKAMDEVRKKEYREHKELKGHKYTFLKNQDNLLVKKQQELAELIILLPTLREAYRLKILFNDLWDMLDKASTKAFIGDWIQQAGNSKIQDFIKLGKTLMGTIRHYQFC